MPNRSMKDERDEGELRFTKTMTTVKDAPLQRNKVGPASDEVRRSEIAKRVAEREAPDSRPAPTPASRPDPLNPANDADPTKDLTVGTAARRIRGYKQKLDDEIENQSK